ncbi:MAG: hypothetical protein HRU37_14840, partial [Roseibacillus sp.]|nr:hypothetical protein [Roseibacillus sp.]
AAITAGAAFVLFAELFDTIGIDIRWATVLFGLGALTYARHPEGIDQESVEALRRRLRSQGY